MSKPLAIWVKCPNGDEADHSNYDNCWFCAPYWIDIAVCAKKHPSESQPGKETQMKLDSRTGYCKVCKKYYDLGKKKN